MIGIISLLATLVISLFVTRVGAVALTLTGMSIESAKFQARSAFTGVGYTTSEAESVVNHPVRRRVVSLLMICGNIGIAVVIASMMAAFAASDGRVGFWRATSLGVGLLALWIVGHQQWVDDAVSHAIEWALRKWTHLDIRDYVSLLHLADGYVVLEIVVNEGDWIGGKSLSETNLSMEGVLVLGLHRESGKYIGSPNGKTIIRVGDTLSVYGPIERLEELDIRKEGYAGDIAHQIAIENQQEAAKKQEIEDPVLSS